LGVAAGSWRCCGGATNPDAAADDEAFRVLIGGTTDADGNYVPPDAAHQTDECIWACPLVCPPAHCRLCPAEGRQKVHFPSACRCARIAAFCEGAASFCADHLQTVRGCLWYHCARSIHVCRQMVMRMVGVDADYRGHNTNNQPRPGIRNGQTIAVRCDAAPRVGRMKAGGGTLRGGRGGEGRKGQAASGG